MATTTEEKVKKTRKKLDLSKVQVADGALKAPRSVYEIVGFPETDYDTRDIDVYRKELDRMQNFELQEHAARHGVLPSWEREITMGRLEEKFMRENSRFVPPGQSVPESNEDLRKQAERIMGRRIQ